MWIVVIIFGLMVCLFGIVIEFPSHCRIYIVVAAGSLVQDQGLSEGLVGVVMLYDKVIPCDSIVNLSYSIFFSSLKMSNKGG